MTSSSETFLPEFITNTFQCCEVLDIDICEKCKSDAEKARDLIISNLELAPKCPKPPPSSENLFVELPKLKKKIQVENWRFFAKGGCSMLYKGKMSNHIKPSKKGAQKSRHPPRGTSYLQFLAIKNDSLSSSKSKNIEEDVILKCVDVNDIDNTRSAYIDTYIHSILYDKASEFVKSLLVKPLSPLFKLPSVLYPGYVISNITPMYDGDVHDLINERMVSDRDLFYVLAAIATALNELQDRCSFTHRDLKFDNVFFKYLPSRTAIPIPYIDRKNGVEFDMNFSPFFKVYLADFGLACCETTNNNGKKIMVGADWWTSCVEKKPNSGVDLCFLTMNALAKFGRDLRKIAPLFHRFLWRMVTCDDVKYGIYALRETNDDVNQQSDYETDEIDDEMLDKKMIKAKALKTKSEILRKRQLEKRKKNVSNDNDDDDDDDIDEFDLFEERMRDFRHAAYIISATCNIKHLKSFIPHNTLKAIYSLHLANGWNE
jgi:hypothetical protein